MGSILTSLEGFTEVGGMHQGGREVQGLGCNWGSSSDPGFDMAWSLEG